MGLSEKVERLRQKRAELVKILRNLTALNTQAKVNQALLTKMLDDYAATQTDAEQIQRLASSFRTSEAVLTREIAKIEKKINIISKRI